MIKRTAVAFFWFLSVWLTYGLVAYFVGLPDVAGGILGSLVAAFVFMDPTGAIWGSADSSRQAIKPARGGFRGSHPTA